MALWGGLCRGDLRAGAARQWHVLPTACNLPPPCLRGSPRATPIRAGAGPGRCARRVCGIHRLHGWTGQHVSAWAALFSCLANTACYLLPMSLVRGREWAETLPSCASQLAAACPCALPAQALRVPPDHHHHPVCADRCAWMGSGGRHACSHDCGIGSVSCAALKCLSSLPPRTNIACSGPQGPAVEPPEDSHQPARPHVRRPAAVAPAPLLGLKQAGIDPFCSRLLSSAPFEYLFRVLRSSCSRAALPVFRPSCQQPTHALARPLYCFVLLPDKHHMPMP